MLFYKSYFIVDALLMYIRIYFMRIGFSRVSFHTVWQRVVLFSFALCSDVLNVSADNRYDDGPLPRYGLITLFTQHANRPCRSINNDTRRLYAPASIRGVIDITNCGKKILRFAVIVVYILLCNLCILGTYSWYYSITQTIYNTPINHNIVHT